MKKRIHKLVVKVEQYGEGVFRTSLTIEGDTPVLSEAIAHEIMEGKDEGGVFLGAIVDGVIEHLENHAEEDEPE